MELVIRDIHKRFQETEVLRGASYRFYSGKITGVLGRMVLGKQLYLIYFMGILQLTTGPFVY